MSKREEIDELIDDEEEILDEEIDEIDDIEEDEEPKAKKAKKAKKPKSKKQKLIIAISIILCVLIVAGAGIGVYIWLNRPGEIDDTDFDVTKLDNSFKPAGTVMTGITIPTTEDSDEMKNLAIQLFNTANANLCKENAYAFVIRTQTTLLGMTTGGYRYFVKNGDEFFNGDYFYVPSGGTNGIMKAAAAESTNSGYRSYWNFKDKWGHEQKAKELNYEIDNDGIVHFGVGWDDLYFDRDLEKVTDDCPQEGKDYRYCQYVWDLDTIKTCKVTYNAEGEYYEIKLTLDCSLDKTLGDSLQYLTGPANDPNARYTNITETVQIWNNGKYKQFYSYDEWSAKYGGIMPVESANDYKTQFVYNEYGTTIRNYQYAEEFITALGY